jgi:molecular chaperone GrpE
MSPKKKKRRPDEGSGPEDGRAPEDRREDEAAAKGSGEGGAPNLPDEAARRIDELDGQVKELTDRLQRKAAEFANYQKRIQKEMDDARRFAAKPLALELLSVIDSFERALGSQNADAENSGGTESILQGMRLIHEQLLSALANHGIVPIDALNEIFDPNLHDAIMEEENSDLPDKTVIDELVKGYTLHERLLRPARVRVSRTPRPEEVESTEPDDEHEADGNSPGRDEDEKES